MFKSFNVVGSSTSSCVSKFDVQTIKATETGKFNNSEQGNLFTSKFRMVDYNTEHNSKFGSRSYFDVST